MPEKIGGMQRRAVNSLNKTDAWRIHVARAQHNDRSLLERFWYIASREPSNSSLDRNFLVFAPKGMTFTTPFYQGF